jgi:hypothetical protein
MTITKHTIKNTILEKIQKGDIVQKPRWQFVLKASMYYCAFVAIVLSALYSLSFIGLIARERELFNMFNLSPKGLQILLSSLPWMIIVSLVLMSAILYLLVRNYSFVYSSSILYGFGILFLGVLLIAVALYSLDPKGRIPCIAIEAGFPGVERLHMQMRPGTNPRPCRHHPVEEGMIHSIKIELGTSSELIPIDR